jgi:hypothetical protein
MVQQNVVASFFQQGWWNVNDRILERPFSKSFIIEKQLINIWASFAWATWGSFVEGISTWEL